MPAPARSASRRCRAAPRNVVFVDTGAEARGLIRDHIEAFGAGGVTKLLRRDATALGAAGTMGPVDLVFLDPPYGKGLGEQALASLRDGGWLKPETHAGARGERREAATVDDCPPRLRRSDRSAARYGARRRVYLIARSV